MGLCKNCKYWDKDRDGFRFEKGMGHCENPIFHEGYDEAKDSETYNSGAIIEDDEGWGWYVAPSFGCIHFDELL
jgi:hypothetical protein